MIRLLSFGAAVVLGFALASVHMLPFLEWLQYSAELQFRTGLGGLRASRLGPKQWIAGIVPMVLPNIFNNPTWPGVYRSFFPGWNFVEQTLYIGVIGLALAAGAIAARRLDKKVWFLAVLGLTTLGAALRLPVFDWINYLPLFNIAAYGRFRLVYTFCMSVLAGLGAQEILDRIKGGDVLRAVIWSLTALVAVGILVLLIAPQILSALNAPTSPARASRVSQAVLSRAFHVSNIGMYWPLLIAAAGALMLTLYMRRLLTRRVVQAILVPLVVVDLFALGMGYHATIREELVFPETPALQLLKSDGDVFRVVGTNIDLMPNTCIIHGLHDVRGLDFGSRRYQELCQAIGGRDWLGYGILFTDSLQPRLMGLLNVKYVLTSSRLGAVTLRDLRLIDVDEDIQIYQNLTWLPRSFIVHRVRVSEDSQEILRILQDPEFDLASEIVLEKPAPAGFATGVVQGGVESSALRGTGTRGYGSPEGDVKITRYESNHVAIQAHAGADGFLFLSDSYYPGWKAYVDGVETEIYRADYAFRAVYLSSGDHTVEFVYEPESFRVAFSISLLALLGVVVLLVIPWTRRVDDPVGTLQV